MSIVTLQTPKGCYQPRYGQLTLYPDEDGRLTVPGSVALLLVKEGFKVIEGSIDGLTFEEEIDANDEDVNFHLGALGLFGDVAASDDCRKWVKERLAKRGQPKVRIDA